MSRYFYRPVDPGYQALGQGIAQGLSSIGQAYVGRQDRQRQQERQDLELDLRLAELGGGRGAAPTTSRMEIDPAGFGPAAPPIVDEERAARTPGLNPESWLRSPEAPARQPGIGGAMQREVLPGAEPERRPIASFVNEPDPDFMSVGGGKFHIMTPDARQRRQAETALELDDLRFDRQSQRQDTARTEQLTRAAEALRARFPSMSEQEALAEAELITGDVANWGDLHPDPRERRPTFSATGTDDWSTHVARLEELNRRNLGGGGRGGVTSTSQYTQIARLAHDYLGAIARLDDFARQYDVSDEEYAAEMEKVAGRYGFESPEHARRAIFQANRADGGLDGMSFDDVYGAGGEDEAPEEDVDAGFTPDSDLSPSEIAQFQTRLQLYPQRKWAETLRATGGFSERQIRQITGDHYQPPKGASQPAGGGAPRG